MLIVVLCVTRAHIFHTSYALTTATYGCYHGSRCVPAGYMTGAAHSRHVNVLELQKYDLDCARRSEEQEQEEGTRTATVICVGCGV